VLIGSVPAAVFPCASSDAATASTRTIAEQPAASSAVGWLSSGAAAGQFASEAVSALSRAAAMRPWPLAIALQSPCGDFLRETRTLSRRERTAFRLSGADSAFCTEWPFAGERRGFGAATVAGISGCGGISSCGGAECAEAWLLLAACGAADNPAVPECALRDSPLVHDLFFKTAPGWSPASPPATACFAREFRRELRSRRFPA
jgi:hypothetical protein